MRGNPDRCQLCQSLGAATAYPANTLRTTVLGADLIANFQAFDGGETTRRADEGSGDVSVVI